MAKNLNAQVHGRTLVRDLIADTVGEVLAQMDVSNSMIATVNGEPASNDQELADFDFIAFSKAVDGGSK